MNESRTQRLGGGVPTVVVRAKNAVMFGIPAEQCENRRGEIARAALVGEHEIEAAVDGVPPVAGTH